MNYHYVPESQSLECLWKSREKVLMDMHFHPAYTNSSLEDVKKVCFMMGDFDLRDICWKTGSVTKNSYQKQKVGVICCYTGV